jgi:hypothetical protein
MGMSPDRYIPKGIRDMDDDDPLKEHYMSKEYVDPSHFGFDSDRYDFAGDKWLRKLRARDAKARGGRPKVAGSIPVPGSLSPEQEAYMKSQSKLTKRKRDRTWRGKVGKIGPTVSVDVPKGASGFWNPPADYLLAAGYYDPKKPLSSLSGFKVPLKTKRAMMENKMTKKEFQRESAKDWATDRKMEWENDMMKSAMDPQTNTVINDSVPNVLYFNDSDINDTGRAFDTMMRRIRRPIKNL